MPIDYERLYANRNRGVLGYWIGPSGADTTLGITNAAIPEAAEINNTGGTSGMLNAAPSTSWSDWAFGQEASETQNEPSLADSSTYEEFGQNNFGGTVSYWLPNDFNDNTNEHKLVFDLTKDPGALIDSVIRIDGDKPTTQPAANGDYVHVHRVEVASEQNPFTPGESKRRNVGYNQKGDFAHYTVVGPHVITPIPAASNPWAAGKKARLRASVQGREYTNALTFTSSNSNVVAIYNGGFYEVTGVTGGTATITIRDVDAGTTATVNVTVT